MQYTDKLGLKKPDLTDYVNVQDLNDNMDVLDEAVGNMGDDLIAHKADYATQEKAGHVRTSDVDENGNLVVDLFKAGNIRIYSNDTLVNNNKKVIYNIVKSVVIGRGGTVRVRFESQSEYIAAYGQIFVNDTPRGVEREVARTTFTWYTEDITNLNPGDVIQIALKSYSTSYATWIRGFEVLVEKFDGVQV